MDRPPGYTYGTADVPPSPISLAAFERMKETAMFTDEDVHYLRLSRDTLAARADEIVDAWYQFIASQPHLIRYFGTRGTGRILYSYLAPVRRRFRQWILDTAAANYDQAWLDYQYEIGLRHHRTKKNQTDRVPAAEHIHFRYLFPLVYPVVSTLKPFLEAGGHPPAEVDKILQAWLKSVLLQVTLWSLPYVKEGDF